MKKVYAVKVLPNRFSFSENYVDILGVYSKPRMAYDDLINSCKGRHGIDAPSYRTCLKHLREKGFVNFQDKELKQTYAQIGRHYLNKLWQKT